MHPVPGGDAVVFLPAAINLKAGQGLTNQLWTYQPDPLGKHRFYEHPPLFQQAVSICMWRAETRNAFVVLAIFNVLSLWIYAAFLCMAKVDGRLVVASRRFGLVVMSVFALAFLVFDSSLGRPESLSTLLLCTGVGLIAWLRQRWQVLVFGALIGATGATHPAHGVLVACIALIILVLRKDLVPAIRDAIIAAVIALGLFWFLLSLGPYGVGETLHALSSHGAYSYAPNYQIVTFYFKLAPWAGAYLVGIALLIGFFGFYIWKLTQSIPLLWIRFAALALTAVAFWFFSIHSANKSFYLIMLGPAMAAGSIYLFKTSNGLIPGWLRTSAVSMSYLLGLLLAAFLARDIALFVNYTIRGVSYADAQNELRKLEASKTPPIFVSESLWVLADNFDRIKIVERGTGAGDVMVVQQNGRQSLTPPKIPGYHAVLDRFISYRPTLFGLPLGRTMPGYAFEVYESEPDRH